MTRSTSLFTKGTTLALMVSLALSSCQPVELTTPVSSTRTNANAKLSAGTDYVDGELLIQFKEGASDNDKQKAFDKVKGQPVEKILTKAMERASKKEGLLLVKVNKNVLEAIADLQSASGVEFAEPNFIYSHAAV
ncbi:MAG: peptidase in kexin sedolisin, partial [Spirosoma sp.]|nr:peptidase in kexin sedolisin [Spirosoma sp.]